MLYFPFSVTTPIQVDHRIRHGGQFRRLRDEDFPRVPAQAQNFPLHRHEHALAGRVERPVGLVAKQGAVATPAVLGKVEGHGTDQALVDPLCREPGYAE